MAFVAKSSDVRYHDIEVSRRIDFSSIWSIDHLDADDEANKMHEQVVDELFNKMKDGILCYDYTKESIN